MSYKSIVCSYLCPEGLVRADMRAINQANWQPVRSVGEHQGAVAIGVEEGPGLSPGPWGGVNCSADEDRSQRLHPLYTRGSLPSQQVLGKGPASGAA